METGPSSVPRNAALVLWVCLLSSSCVQDDWIVTLTCDGAFSRLTPVTTELFVDGKRAFRTAYLNPSRLSLGDVVLIGSRLSSGPPEVEWHIPTPSADEISPASVRLRSISINDGFQVKFERDIKTAATLAGVDLQSEVIKSTDLHVGGAVIRALRDATSVIERNPEVVEKIRTAIDARFAVVSGTITGQYIVLEPAWESFSAVDTFYFGGTYVHVIYSCAACSSYSEGMSTGDDAPVIYLTPVRYDQRTAQIVADPPSPEVLRHD